MNLKKLREIAEAATPGPWITCEHICGGMMVIHENDKDLAPEVSEDEDATYIATFNPTTVLKLLALAEAAKEEYENRVVGPKLREALKALEDSDE